MNQTITLPPKTAAFESFFDRIEIKEIQYRVFCCVWAIATLFHLADERIFDNQLHWVLLTGSAIFLLAKPSSFFRLLLLIYMQLFEVVKSMPFVSNHWIFTAFVNLTILFAAFYLIIKRQSFQTNTAELFETFAPAVRIEVLILYFYVVFHKLNTGFFAYETSCASDLYLSQNAYSLLPETPFFLSLNAYFTVVIEALIPILLCFRKTRNWGIFIGIVFHAVIAFNPFNGFYDFSSMVFAVYFLFSDHGWSKRIWTSYEKVLVWKRNLGATFQKFELKKAGIVLIIALSGFVIIFVLGKRFEDFFRHIFWLPYCGIFIYFAVLSVLNKEGEETENKKIFSLPHYSFLLFPLLVFLNGFSPYLGLKTENSFAMFSNLRTEGGETNHFLIPSNFQVFDFQKDLVEIVSSSDPELQKLANESKLVVFSQFKHIVSQVRPEKVDYILNGNRHTFSLTGNTDELNLLEGNPFLLRKLFSFRAITKGEIQPCAH